MWGKIYEDTGEQGLYLPKTTFGGLWTLGYLVVLVLLLCLGGNTLTPYLSIPVALIGLSVFCTYLMGLTGVGLVAPVLIYGWMSLLWTDVYCTPDFVHNTMAGAIYLLLMFACVLLILLPTLRAIVLLALGEGVICISFWVLLHLTASGATVTAMPLNMGQTSEAMMLALLVAAAVFAILCAYQDGWRVFQSASSKREAWGGLVLFGAGFVPVIVGLMLSQANGAVAALAVLACYAALTLLACKFGVRGVRWLLAPLVLVVSLGVLARGTTDGLMPHGGIYRAIMAYRGSALASVCAGALPLAKGCAQLFSVPGMALAGLLPLDAAKLSKLALPSLLAVYAEVFVASCIMGPIVHRLGSFSKALGVLADAGIPTYGVNTSPLTFRERLLSSMDRYAGIKVPAAPTASPGAGALAEAEDGMAEGVLANTDAPIPNRRFGLWWKVLEPDGSFAIFPKRTWFWTMIVVLPVLALLVLLSAKVVPHTALPLLLIGLSLSATYLLGIVGLGLTAPAMVYGCSAIVWVIVTSESAFRADVPQSLRLVAAFAFVLTTCFFFMTMKLPKEMGWIFSLAFIAAAVPFFGVSAVKQGKISEGMLLSAMEACYVLSFAQVAFFGLLNVYRFCRMRATLRFSQRALEQLELAALGFVPLVAGGVCKGLPPIAVVAIVLACYAALAVVAHRWLLRSSQDMGMMLVPLLVAGTIALCLQAPVKRLPPYGFGASFYAWLGKDALAGMLAGGSLPFADGVSTLLVAPEDALFRFLMGAKAGAKAMKYLAPSLSLHLGIVLAASAMGVAVSICMAICNKRGNKQSD